MVMVRCGIDTETYLDKDDFRNITDFNTPELVNLFGTATSDVAEMALGEISDTILKLQKEEKRRSRTFAGENAGRYNESEKDKNNASERGFDDERDSLQQTGGLLNLKIVYTYSLLIHCLQIPRRNQTIQKRNFCR